MLIGTDLEPVFSDDTFFLALIDQETDTSACTHTDVLEVNGMTVDWTTRLLYWTDARRRTIEVSDYDGNRRTLSVEGLLAPRGIVVDPVGG